VGFSNENMCIKEIINTAQCKSPFTTAHGSQMTDILNPPFISPLCKRGQWRFFALPRSYLSTIIAKEPKIKISKLIIQPLPHYHLKFLNSTLDFPFFKGGIYCSGKACFAFFAQKM
jgi:hypothetical protein